MKLKNIDEAADIYVINTCAVTNFGDKKSRQLLRKVNEIEGLERIRFMTSHPKDLSDELIIAMKECDKVCNHIHLPFQAGNNEILKSMNRRYTKEHYLELVEKIRKENS